MPRQPFVRPALACLALACLFPAVAGAQELPGASSPPAMKRWDVAGTIGWNNVEVQDGLWDRWERDAAVWSATLGRYWTDHLKTEVEVTGGSKMRFQGFDPDAQVSPIYDYTVAFFTVRAATVTASVGYQFFRNAWFHPFLAAGLDVSRERQDIHRPAQRVPVGVISFGYGQQYMELPPYSRTSSSTVARGFAAGGFKLYVSQRAFIRHDFKLAFRDEVDRAVLRIGVGFDF